MKRVPLYKEDDNVYFISPDTGNFITGKIFKIKRSIFSFKYLIQYAVRDIDLNYEYRTVKWIKEKNVLRLIR